jgi:hypothetical protein
MRRIVLAAAAAAALCLGLCVPPSGAHGFATLDEVIAAPAYNTVLPVPDADMADYHQRVTQRLEYLESLLRVRDVSGWPTELRNERMKNIQRLHDYRVQGAFPINYDHPEQQLPCFLDRDGNLCAVANLIAQSEGMELVEKINQRYQYATVAEMALPELDAWIAGSGLTRDEVITIQEPGFTRRELPDPFVVTAQLDSSSISSPVDTAAAPPARMQQGSVQTPTLSQSHGE